MAKIILAYELLKRQVSKAHIIKDVCISRRTVIHCVQDIDERGSLDNFLKDYQQGKKGPLKKWKTAVILKRCIWTIWEQHHSVLEKRPVNFSIKTMEPRAALQQSQKSSQKNISSGLSAIRTKKGSCPCRPSYSRCNPDGYG